MGQTFFEKWRGRVRGAWHVLIGKAYAGYSPEKEWLFDHAELIKNLERESQP